MAQIWDDDEFWDLEGEKVLKAILPFLALVLAKGVIVGYAAIGVEFGEAAANEWAIDFARSYGYELVRGITETSREFLQDEIGRWLASGDHLDKLVEKIEASGMFGEVRARMIAITETTRAYQMGKVEAWKGSGKVKGYRFMTAEDELVCPICGEANGKEYGLEDLDHSPPLHVQCRCWSVPVLEGEE